MYHHTMSLFEVLPLRVENIVHPSSHRVPFFSLLHPCPNLSSSSGFPCSCSEFCGLVLLPGSGEAKQGHRELLNDSCLSVNLWV